MMGNERRELGGSDAGLVIPASDWNVFACSLAESYGCKIPRRVSVDAGPVISMLPISKRRSSICTTGRWSLDRRSISAHVSRNAEGWILTSTLRLAGLVLSAAGASL